MSKPQLVTSTSNSFRQLSKEDLASRIQETPQAADHGAKRPRQPAITLTSVAPTLDLASIPEHLF